MSPRERRHVRELSVGDCAPPVERSADDGSLVTACAALTSMAATAGQDRAEGWAPAAEGYATGCVYRRAHDLLGRGALAEDVRELIALGLEAGRARAANRGRP